MLLTEQCDELPMNVARRKKVAVVVAALAAIVMATPSAASAGEARTSGSVQAEIDKFVRDGAVRVNATTVSWDGGRVILDLAPTAGSRTTRAEVWHGCPVGWFRYNFGHKASSWVNNTARTFDPYDGGVVDVYDHQPRFLFTMERHRAYGFLSPSQNDKAVFFTCHQAN